MAFSTAGFPEGLIREMLEGIVEDETAFADGSVGRRITEKTSMSGRIPIRGTQGGVARGQNRKLGPLEEAKAYNYGVTFVQYNAGAYPGYGLLSDEERNDAEYFFDRDAVELEIRTATREANTGLDRDYGDLLADPVVNQPFDVLVDGSGNWGVSTTAMANDLRNLREVIVPKADTIIIGRQAANLMLNNDDLLATPLGGNAYVGGTGAKELLAEWLVRYIGFTDVQYMERLYNSSDVAVDEGNETLEYIFDFGVWVGYGDDLVLVHPNAPDQDTLEIERVTRKRAHEIQYVRYDDLIRPSLKKGATVQNISTPP